MPLLLAHIIFGIFCSCFLIYIALYVMAYGRLAFKKPASRSPYYHYPPVSVVICARDEEANIQKNLPSVLEQDYPSFEVIVVNDCSSDRTGAILDDLVKQYNNLRHLTIVEDKFYKHGKKLAMTVGIRAAQNDILVFTDADCSPRSKNWLKEIAGSFSPETDIVLGYGGYAKGKGIINKLIRMDAFRIGLQYLSLALAGFPYMGTGRDLAYRKSLFLKQKGFYPFSHIPSGDDDLFINRAATKANTKVIATFDSVTLSVPRKSFKQWLWQKRRHITTARYYKNSTLFILALISFSQYGFFLTFLALLSSKEYMYYSIAIFLVMMITEGVLFNRVMNRLGENDLFLFSFLLEWLLLFVFYPIVSLSNMVLKKAEWKT